MINMSSTEGRVLLWIVNDGEIKLLAMSPSPNQADKSPPGSSGGFF